MFKRRYNVTILNTLWVPIKRDIKLKVIPRRDEFIYLKDVEKYFEVVNVVYTLSDTQEIFVIIKELEKQPNVIDSKSSS